ncbi:hypothetical protein B566_EDAN014744 [Ephemera danica]|nr:hypothetical protein B566_EDAN014744 [Ephemera danica]
MPNMHGTSHWACSNGGGTHNRNMLSGTFGSDDLSSRNVEFLLNDGYVGARDNSGDTDLRYDTMQSGTERCAKNMQICDRESNTVLHYASRNGNKEIMHLLLQRDLTLINMQNMHGETPLHIAIEENNFDAAHYILSFKECLLKTQMRDQASEV